MASIFERYQKGTSFTNWSERLGYFFDASHITDSEMKKAYLITLLDAAIFSELKLLVSNRDLKLVPYEEIVRRLRNRYDHKECEFVQRYKFNNRVQQPAETVQEFIYAVKLQAEFCGFGNFKQTAIVDRIVFGIRDKVLQRRLLCEDKLTVEATEKIIATWELTGASNVQVRSVKERLGAVPMPSASDDGYDDETTAADYQPKLPKNRSESICGFCGKLGHVTRRCFAMKNLKKKVMGRTNGEISAPTRDSSPDRDDDDYNWKRSKRSY